MAEPPSSMALPTFAQEPHSEIVRTANVVELMQSNGGPTRRTRLIVGGSLTAAVVTGVLVRLTAGSGRHLGIGAIQTSKG